MVRPEAVTPGKPPRGADMRKIFKWIGVLVLVLVVCVGA